MTTQGRALRPGGRCRLWLAAFTTLQFVAGCHTVQTPSPCLLEPFRVVPQCCKDRVHIFIINGVDPLDWTDLRGLREYFISLGFNNCSYGQFYCAGHPLEQIRRIHAADPEARFVLVGFSFGANTVRHVTNEMKGDGIPVDLLVYLGGNTLKNSPRARPENAKRVLNILSLGVIWNGATIDGAENIRMSDVLHFGSPAHPETVELLTRELAIVASGIPIIEIVEHEVGKQPPTDKLPAEWEFLQPAGRLSPPR